MVEASSTTTNYEDTRSTLSWLVVTELASQLAKNEPHPVSKLPLTFRNSAVILEQDKPTQSGPR